MQPEQTFEQHINKIITDIILTTEAVKTKANSTIRELAQQFIEVGKVNELLIQENQKLKKELEELKPDNAPEIGADEKKG